MDTSEKKQFLKHVREIRLAPLCDVLDAPTLTQTVVYAWSRQIYPNLDLVGFKVAKSAIGVPAVVKFLDWLSQKRIEEAAYLISSAYALWIGKREQKSLAMFFTPPALTERLLDDIEKNGVSYAQASFLDPACGGAAFLAPIAVRMRQALIAAGKKPIAVLKHIEEKLFGTDIDKTLCLLSKHFLRMVVHEEINSTSYEPQFRIVQANSLTDLASMFGTIDVVVSNPPYRKLMPEELKIYSAEFEETIEGQPNLYGLFIALAVKLIKNGDGLAALVTPTSFMSGRNFSKLRKHLLETVDVSHIGVISERSGVFISVEQETALTILKKKILRTEKIQTSKAEVAVVSKNGQYKSVGDCVLPSHGMTWPIPRNDGDGELIQLASASTFRLSHYGYKVRIGAFVWNRDQRPTYFSMAEAKNEKAAFAVPLLWSSDIRQDGIVKFSESQKENGEPAFVDVGVKEHRSFIKQPSILLQRVTSNDQTKRLIAAAVPEHLFLKYGGFVAENHIVILESETRTPKIAQDVVIQLLGSNAIDRYFRCISGATNVSVFELAQLPLPCPLRLTAALERGATIDDAVSFGFET